MNFSYFRFQISLFNERHPAFFTAFTLFLGILFAFHYLYALIPFIFFLFFIPARQVFLFLLLFLAPLPYLEHKYHFPQKQLSGVGGLKISNKRIFPGKGFLYQGTLLTFQTKNEIYKQVPLSFFTKNDLGVPAFISIQGELSPTYLPTNVQIKKTKILSIKGKNYLLDLRLKTKNFLLKRLKKNYRNFSCFSFLSAMLLGESVDKELKELLQQSGLSHLAAISGFHFALLAYFLYRSLFFLKKEKAKAFLLLLLLTLYYLLIGAAPSVERAWLFVVITLFSQILERKARPLNTLGVAMLILLVKNPLSALSNGFQLSFTATCGILLFYPLLEPKFKKALSTCMPSRAASWLSAQLALNGSVQLIIIPLSLMKFHYFSSLSILLNLVIPLFAAGWMLGCLIGLVLGPLGAPLNAINQIWMQNTLFLIDLLPLGKFLVFWADISNIFLVFLLTLLLFTGVIFYNKNIKCDS